MSRPARDEHHQELDDMQDLLRTSDVAALFRVSTRTVSEWARRGRVPCMRTPGGQWRYPADPIRQLVNLVEQSPREYLALHGPSDSALTRGVTAGTGR